MRREHSVIVLMLFGWGVKLQSRFDIRRTYLRSWFNDAVTWFHENSLLADFLRLENEEVSGRFKTVLLYALKKVYDESHKPLGQVNCIGLFCPLYCSKGEVPL